MASCGREEKKKIRNKKGERIKKEKNNNTFKKRNRCIHRKRENSHIKFKFSSFRIKYFERNLSHGGLDLLKFFIWFFCLLFGLGCFGLVRHH